jgi:cellulose synthase/poly-beta-1,6-N-acetylglucosamine synthase-like glycosyltransferase
MYCPRCATKLDHTATRCHECGLDVRPVADLLREDDQSDLYAATRVTARLQRFKRQRSSWGTLLIMSSLLVGCLIPISIGLFRESDALSSIILALAGFAGLLLITGSMLLMASENTILVGDETPADAPAARSQNVEARDTEQSRYATTR